jgi:hypothetical protein
VHVWRTPHGYRFRVDGTGTHALGRGLDKLDHPGPLDHPDVTPLERAVAAILDR